MPPWKPADARRKYGLTLTPADRTKIDANMAPLTRGADGLYDADAVFEGGGVLGTAFLGAVRCCCDIGLKWHALAGTSAGAITATLVAADLNIDQLELVIGQLDYMSLLSKKTSRLIFNGDPSDDLDHPVQLLTNLALTHELGQYSSDPFRDWLEGILNWVGRPSFGDVWDRTKSVNDRQLKVVISDLTHGEMKVLPDDLESTAERPAGVYRPPLSAKQRAFSVAEAVRLSMSIPFFFTPGVLEHPTDGRCTVVDGGILSNFPLWLFDEDSPGKPPAWPTFGFRLTDQATAKPAAIASVTDVLSAMLKTMMVASDRRYLSQRHLGRVVDIDLTGANVTATQFGLTNDQKDVLYARGYLAAKEFFAAKWSWKKHLELRGY